MNQQFIKNPNAEHEMEVTLSQQMMNIGDFPSPINENLLRYRKKYGERNNSTTIM